MRETETQQERERQKQRDRQKERDSERERERERETHTKRYHKIPSMQREGDGTEGGRERLANSVARYVQEGTVGIERENQIERGRRRDKAWEREGERD